MKKKFDTKRLVLLAMLAGILLVMSFTPLGYLNIGPLAISLNMIPVAIGAAALGPSGGAVLGAVFGITSCLQCVGIGGSSAMGMILFEISPLLALTQRFLPRLLAGLLSGLVFRLSKRLGSAAYFITGFAAAFLNTLLFMLALILFFYSTPYLQGLIGGKNVLLFAVTFVGINAAVEMLASTAVTGLLGSALHRANLLGR